MRGFVVSLLWSFLEPGNERRIKEIIQQEYHSAFLGAMPVFLSSDVAPRMYEYPRTMMTVLNAYLHQSMYEELSGIGDELRDRGYRRPMMMIHNTGGMASVLRTSAVNTYNGGPVAGLMGSSYIGWLYGYDNVVTSDMGGTSFDIGMVAEGSPRFYQFMPVIDRWLVDATIIDTLSIGAGGGSIARVNDLIANRVEVGPESAGSMPGPAAYNQGGTEPTVTDADVVLGYINPEYFHGGAIGLDHGRAERAIEQKVAEPLGISVEEAALMIRRIVDGNMGQAIWRETVLKGFDPREFILFAFGGAGPTHCCGYARVAEMDRVVIFPFAPTFCAFGSSTMDIVHLYERSRQLHLLDPATHEYLDDYETFNETVRRRGGGAARLPRRGVRRGRDRVHARARHEVRRPAERQAGHLACAPDRSEEDVVRIRESFEREYSEAYSSLGVNPEAGIEIHDFVLRGRVAQPKPELELHAARARTRRLRGRTRPAYWDRLGCGHPRLRPERAPVRQRGRRTGAHRGRGHHDRRRAGVALPLDEYMNGIMEFQPGVAKSARRRHRPRRPKAEDRRSMFDLKLVEEGIKPVPASEDELEAVGCTGPGDYEIYSEMLTIIVQEGKEIMTKMGISSMLHSVTRWPACTPPRATW